MPRTAGVPGGRTERLSTALSPAEMDEVDERRGSLNRAEFLRWLVKRAIADDVRFEWVRRTRPDDQ